LKQPSQDRIISKWLITVSQGAPSFEYRRVAAPLSLSEWRMRRLCQASGLNIARWRRSGGDTRLPGGV